MITVRWARVEPHPIRDKAIAGPTGDAEPPTGDDNLLFMPGFFHRGKVSNLPVAVSASDVVKTPSPLWGGRITSQPARARVTISLPLTSAVMDGMVISVAGRPW